MKIALLSINSSRRRAEKNSGSRTSGVRTTVETISVDETASRLKICVGSVIRLIRAAVLPATQLMPSAPWKVPVDALKTEAVQAGVRAVIARRPRNFAVLQGEKTLRLPGF